MRFGADSPKALVPLAGRPMLLWSIDALRVSPSIDEVVLLCPPGGEAEMRAALGEAHAGVRLVDGGASRAESVREGVRAASARATRILVHDAARPLVTPALIDRVLGAMEGVDGAIAAAPSPDTLKRADGDLIGGTVDRAGLWGAQTPQAFWAPALRAAIAAAEAEGRLARATDCASLLEARGGRVRLVASLEPNLKVTTRADARLAAALLAARQ